MVAKKRISKRVAVPDNFESLEGFWKFWDKHSSADYEDLMEEVDLEIDISSEKAYCAVAKDVLTQVRREARHQGVSTSTLINLWLQEKVTQVSQRHPA